MLLTAGQLKNRESGHLVNHVLFPQFALRQVQNLFKSDFSTKGDLVLPFLDLQYTAVSLKQSSSCLLLIPRLPVTSNLPYFFLSITCFRRQFVPNMWSVISTFLFSLFLRYFFPPFLFVILHSSRCLSNWTILSLFSSKFENIQEYYCLSIVI